MNLILSLIIAYLIGSIPTAFIVAKFFKGIDIRDFGSGNVGATNVYRTVGKISGVIVLLVDALKGFLPVIVLPSLLQTHQGLLSLETYKILVGAAAIAGHVWTIFLKFKGGKGVATTAGVLFAITPKVFLIAFLIWVVFFVVFRYVSLASIISAISLPIISITLRQSFGMVLFFIIIAFIGSYKHKSNISRLIKGEEKKIF